MIYTGSDPAPGGREGGTCGRRRGRPVPRRPESPGARGGRRGSEGAADVVGLTPGPQERTGPGRKTRRGLSPCQGGKQLGLTQGLPGGGGRGGAQTRPETPTPEPRLLGQPEPRSPVGAPTPRARPRVASGARWRPAGPRCPGRVSAGQGRARAGSRPAADAAREPAPSSPVGVVRAGPAQTAAERKYQPAWFLSLYCWHRLGLNAAATSCTRDRGARGRPGRERR